MQKVRPEGPDREMRRLDWPAQPSIWEAVPRHFKRAESLRRAANPLLYRPEHAPLPVPMKLVSIPANPVPEARPSGPSRRPTGSRCALRASSRRPAARARCASFPGRAEFIEKYFEVVRDARARGFAVATLDWRGQGLSERALPNARKGHVYDFSEYDRDLEAFMKEIVLPDCPPPLFRARPFDGRGVLIRSAQHGRRWFDRIVLTRPDDQARSRVPGSRYARGTARFLRLVGMGSSYVPGGGGTPINTLPFAGNMLTSDPVRYARTAAIIEAEPALAHRLADRRLDRLRLQGDERIRRSELRRAACASRCCWSPPGRTRSSRRRRSGSSRCGCAPARIW